MSVFRIHDGQRWRRSVTVTPVYSRTRAVNVKTEPEHRVWLVELDVFRKNGALFPGNAYTKVQIVRKVRLMRQTLVERWSAALLNLACAYGGLLFRTVHVLRFLQGFVPSPGYHVHPPRLSMISGASFSGSNVTPSGNFCRSHHDLP